LGNFETKMASNGEHFLDALEDAEESFNEVMDDLKKQLEALALAAAKEEQEEKQKSENV